MNRRRMLRESLQWGAGMTLGLFLRPADLMAVGREHLPSLLRNPLRFPPVFPGGTMELSLANVTVWPGTTTQVVGINNSYPCPTVRLQRGATLSATLVNHLTEPATVHWHGLIVPESMDGHPKDPVLPGSSYTYTFPIVQRAGTYFYHAHAHMLTAEHVYRGFAGLFIIDDDNEIPLGLPRGEFDVPLVIQDRKTIYQPQFTYSPTNMEMMVGYLGDVVLVNGTPDPYFEVSRTLYRFRLVNGSNARVYRVGFADGHQFHIIATDGGLKDQAVEATSFFLSPGERVDILMDFSSYAIGQTVMLESLPYTGGGGSQGMALGIIRFDVTGNQSSGGVVPSSMPAITYYDPLDVVRTRTFTLSMGMGMMMMINGRTFEMMRVDEEVPMNELERWRFVNQTTVFHPMHVHGALFQVLSRNGIPGLPPADRGWKDTVLVHPSETVDVLVKFTDYDGMYLLHCHNLEHEDAGMMMNFMLNGMTDVEEGQTPTEFWLDQNYPNPFNPSTTIRYGLPQAAFVTLAVYNALGQEVAVLVTGEKAPGSYEVKFDASGLASGMYLCRFSAGSVVKTRKMVLAR